MRRANTTFVNLRSALNDVDPLVEASKPVAKRLQPVPLAGSGLRRRRRADRARPQRHDPAPGRHERPDRPAALVPAAGRHRHGQEAAQLRAGRQAVDVGETRGAFQETVDAFKGGARDRLRPSLHHRLPRLVRRLLHHRRRLRRPRRDARGFISMSPVLHAGLRWRPSSTRRCPGAAEAPAKDGSNVLSEAEQRGARLRRGRQGGRRVRRAARIARRARRAAPAPFVARRRVRPGLRRARPTRSCSTTPSASSRAATSGSAA